jgi:hypothetical protein
MAVTVTYSWQLVKTVDLSIGPAQGASDVVGLANGGFAAVGDDDTLTDLDIFDANANHTGGAINLHGTQSAIAQLSDGNLVVIRLEDGLFQAAFSILGADGGLVGGGLVGGENTRSIDVAALSGGGFVTALSDFGDGGPAFVQIDLFNNAGTFLAGFPIMAPNDQDFFFPVVAGLDDGGFALAWEQDNGDIWTAVYNFNGSVRRAPAVFDQGINGFVAITATDNGFAIAYEDSDFSPNTDIALATIDANGGFLDFVTLSGPATIDQTPRLTRMPEGMIGIVFGMSQVSTNDSETFLELYDPATRTIVASRTVLAGQPITDDTDFPVIASHGQGRAAVFHTNRTDDDADGEDLEAVRTSTGDASNDAIIGNDFVDVMNGNDGADFMNGLAANDRLNGNNGDDTMLGGAGDDTLNGGGGIDTASYTSATGAVAVNLSLSGAQTIGGGAGRDTLIAVENLVGSSFNDTLTGSSGNNRLDGNFGGDSLRGGLGNDTYVVNVVSDGIVENFNAGLDTVETFLASYSLVSIANVERLIYTDFNNFVGRGNGLANTIIAAGGDDRFVVDQGGADRFFGDAGNDAMDFRPGAGAAVVNLTTGVHAGAAAGDFYSSIEAFYGSDTAGDTFTGAAFNDRLDGYGGNDTLSGLGGNDTLMGGNGNDEIAGGALLDFLYGNAGADDFNYAALSDSGPTSGARDRIYDFQAGSDDIDVSAIDARAGSAGNNAFTGFIASAAFTAEGQVRWFQSGANTVIEFNTTGTTGAEMQIQLQNFTASNLTAGDFIA